MRGIRNGALGKSVKRSVQLHLQRSGRHRLGSVFFRKRKQNAQHRGKVRVAGQAQPGNGPRHAVEEQVRQSEIPPGAQPEVCFHNGHGTGVPADERQVLRHRRDGDSCRQLEHEPRQRPVRIQTGQMIQQRLQTADPLLADGLRLRQGRDVGRGGRLRHASQRGLSV